jgi:transposase-like protein
MEEQGWSHFACPNPDCPLFGQRGQNNLRPHGWSSKAQRIRCLRCIRCGKNFSERAGTPLFRSHLPEAKVVDIAAHLAEGTGARPTSRLCGVRLNTVLRWSLQAGQHAQAFHDELVRHVEPRLVQADEAWAFVGKKRQAL